MSHHKSIRYLGVFVMEVYITQTMLFYLVSILHHTAALLQCLMHIVKCNKSLLYVNVNKFNNDYGKLWVNFLQSYKGLIVSAYFSLS